ncbi:glutamate--tRNA ligase [Candidatus Dojkabacteria bacterium]|nr:glutamate--tRNA ligase [Candidatus Dojkabacteria bacterium]
MTVRTRFAPSPTGSVHIGGIRTALYAYAYAKHYKGEFILRVEDTDRKRFVTGSIENIIDNLNLYGVPADLQPDKESIERAEKEGTKDISEPNWILEIDKLKEINEDDFDNIYIQSQRLPLYQKYALELLEKGNAYICFATAEQLAQLRKEADEKKQRFIYKGQFEKYALNEETLTRIKNGEKFVVRLNVEKYMNEKGVNEVTYDGTVYPLNEVDDQVLMKSDGIPTYHLAVVVDDHFMKITHAMRAAEWIPSTPKQVMLYDMLGWDMPQYIHVTAILNPNGKGKLSKRDGSVSSAEFLQEGYLPEAMLNFLMLLGWSSPEKHEHGAKEREFYTLSEFVELFDIQNLNKSNPVFNREKLLWFNQKYLSNLPNDSFVLKFTQWLKDYDKNEELNGVIVEKGPDYLGNVLLLIKERVRLLAEIPEMIRPFYISDFKVDLSCNKQTDKIDKSVFVDLLNDFKQIYQENENIVKWAHEGWEATVRELAEKYNIKAGQAFMGLRLVILGTPFSPPLFESMVALGDEECIKRLNRFLD